MAKNEYIKGKLYDWFGLQKIALKIFDGPIGPFLGYKNHIDSMNKQELQKYLESPAAVERLVKKCTPPYKESE